MKNFLIIPFFILCIGLKAQDTIALMNGTVLPVKNVTLSGYKIAYRTVDKNKLRKIDTEKVFSIQ